MFAALVLVGGAVALAVWRAHEECKADVQEAEAKELLSFAATALKHEMAEEAKLEAEERRETRDRAKEAERKAEAEMEEAAERQRLRTALQERLRFYETHGELMDIELKHEKVTGLVTGVTEAGFSVDLQGQGAVILPVLFEELESIELYEPPEEEEEEPQQPQSNP